MGMSQEELGFALHMEGKSVIYGYESNRRGISGDILVDLAKLLHSTPEYIMNGESPADEDPYISAVVSLMKGMKTDKRRRIALSHIFFKLNFLLIRYRELYSIAHISTSISIYR